MSRDIIFPYNKILFSFAMAAIVGVLFYSYSVAITPKPSPIEPIKPPAQSVTVLQMGITYKNVTKVGPHGCADDPKVLCNGLYIAKVPVPKNQTLSSSSPNNLTK